MKSNQVKIRCNSRDFYRCHIFIYNSSNQLVYDQKFQSNETILFFPPNSDIYQVSVVLSNYICRISYKTNFFYCGGSSHIYLNFHLLDKKTSPSITIQLTDQNYKGLPIMKGEVQLWQKHM